MVDATEQSMLFSLIIPFGFMLFMSFSIEKVWGMYNMLQMLSNYINLDSVLLPPTSSTFLQVLHNVSNFNLMKNPFVQYWLATYVFTHAENLKNYLFNQDSMVLMVGGSSFLLLVIFVLSKVFKK